MSEKKTITATAKISNDIDGRMRAEATRLRLDRSEFIRQAIEEKLAGRDAVAETLGDLELKIVALVDAVRAIGESQRKIVSAVIDLRGKQ